MLELLKMSGSRQMVSTTGDQKSGNVLISKKSQQVGLLINETDSMNFIITVDSENLLRCWNVQDCQTAFSYKIPMQ